MGEIVVLESKSKIRQNMESKTQYITVPASIVVDSQYPFKKGEDVIIEVDIQNERMIIRKAAI